LMVPGAKIEIVAYANVSKRKARPVARKKAKAPARKAGRRR